MRVGGATLGTSALLDVIVRGMRLWSPSTPSKFATVNNTSVKIRDGPSHRTPAANMRVQTSISCRWFQISTTLPSRKRNTLMLGM